MSHVMLEVILNTSGRLIVEIENTTSHSWRFFSDHDGSTCDMLKYSIASVQATYEG